MEAALLSGLIRGTMPKLLAMVGGKYKLHKGLKRDMDFLVKELNMINAAINDELSLQIGYPGAVVQLSIEELRELAHDIEDCIDKILYRATRKQQSSMLARSFRFPKTLYTELQLAQEMQRLKNQAEVVNNRKQRYTVASQPSPATLVEEYSDPRIIDANLIGVEEPLSELREQLAEAGEGQPRQLKVISIVGFSGSGKTALAAEVFNQEARNLEESMFDKHAWVCATHKQPKQVLEDMLQRLSVSDAHSCQRRMEVDISGIGQLCVNIKKHLDKKRYLIVIDDIREEDHWNKIKVAFPALQNGYVLKMTRLSENYSKQLFNEKACPKNYSHYKQPNSAAILKKCDGQPLALVRFGEFLRRNGWPTGPKCKEICKLIQYHLGNKTFEAMRQIMIHNYTSLRDHAFKVCLLYFCMFPFDQPIRRESLLTRWLAEGFLESASNLEATVAFNELMDRNIIHPINVSDNCDIKTCKAYGMMHEFLLHKAISENFVTLFCDEKFEPLWPGERKKFEPRYVRRLSVHGNTAIDGDSSKNIKFSLVRSLTIFGEVDESVLDFSKYQLLRVLDLEKCCNLKDDHLKGIWNLLLLKYLSIGGKVTRLPNDIAKLEHLEALDLRRTEVDTVVVPVEVFQLPCLIHLFGKIKLLVPDSVQQKTEVLEFLSRHKSTLETLAGFVTNGSEEYLHLMGFMNKLRKVKIWCKSSAGSTDMPIDLIMAIQRFILDEDETNTGERTLSLHFIECSANFLNSLEGSFYLTSLKLNGSFPNLGKFFLSLRGLEELCISSSKHTITTDLLKALSTLSDLKYVKLIAYKLEEFTIDDKMFPNLLRLCIELQCPTFPSIKYGALQYLDTLQVLCKDLKGPADVKIERLTNLKEVTLHDKVAPEIREQWEKAAKEHPRRPKLLFLNSVHTAECDLSTDYPTASEQAEIVAAESSLVSSGAVQKRAIQPPLNQGSESYSSVPKKQSNCADQSGSNDYNDLAISEISHALDQLPNWSNGKASSYT
uniref:NBS-LRR disease resistance protein family-1 n=1 Tax=Oryza ridleyi TaxID=83308 RepID=E0CWC4_9ORYZ|nr:NBS-LRR disease resistance protein family-1 [Oryza ridleyi]